MIKEYFVPCIQDPTMMCDCPLLSTNANFINILGKNGLDTALEFPPEMLILRLKIMAIWRKNVIKFYGDDIPCPVLRKNLQVE